ncbi:MAG: hypothetical protein ACTSVZ_02165 [Promethearchaeota archaeon]
MILFVLFSPMSGSPVVQMRHTKNCKSLFDEKVLDPYILTQMAKSLYIIGTELQSGGLKELDLTHYSMVTHLDSDYLLILGVDNHSKPKKKFKSLREGLGDLHAEFLKVTKQLEDPGSFPLEKAIEILSRTQIKKESKHLIYY